MNVEKGSSFVIYDDDVPTHVISIEAVDDHSAFMEFSIGAVASYFDRPSDDKPHELGEIDDEASGSYSWDGCLNIDICGHFCEPLHIHRLFLTLHHLRVIWEKRERMFQIQESD